MYNVYKRPSFTIDTIECIQCVHVNVAGGPWQWLGINALMSPNLATDRDAWAEKGSYGETFFLLLHITISMYIISIEKKKHLETKCSFYPALSIFYQITDGRVSLWVITVSREGSRWKPKGEIPKSPEGKSR